MTPVGTLSDPVATVGTAVPERVSEAPKSWFVFDPSFCFVLTIMLVDELAGTPVISRSSIGDGIGELVEVMVQLMVDGVLGGRWMVVTIGSLVTIAVARSFWEGCFTVGVNSI